MTHTVAACIPCHNRYICYIPYCLRSIAEQTQKPDMVVLSVSELPDKTPLEIDPALGLRVEIVRTPAYKPSGGNRNIAAARAIELGATLLMFFDVDDLMAPHRTETILAMFDQEPITGLIHNYIIRKKHEMDLYKGLKRAEWPVGERKLFTKAFAGKGCGKFYGFQYIGPSNPGERYGHVASGHCTAIADAWKAHPYREDIGLGEDQEFVYWILKEGTLGYTPAPLSLYMRN